MHVDTLESRRLMSVTLNPSTGELKAVGTAGDDDIRFTSGGPGVLNVSVAVKGGPFTTYAFNTSQVKKITAQGLAGWDSLAVGLDVAIPADLDAGQPGAGTSSEFMEGGAGNDVLRAPLTSGGFVGGRGADVFYLGSNSYAYGDEGQHNDPVGGSDTFYLSAGGHDTVVYGEGGSDVVYMTGHGIGAYGGPGNDRFRVSGAEDDDNYVFGEAGIDGVEYDQRTDALLLGTASALIAAGYSGGRSGNLASVYANGPSWGTYIGDAENISGGSGNDRIYGDANGNVLRGNGGNDDLYGGAGDDLLDGGAGYDRLFGGDGNDSLYAADGYSDYLDGGAGYDSSKRDNALDSNYNVEAVLP